MSQKGFVYLLDAMEIMLKDNSLPKKPLVLTFSLEDGFIREEREAVQKRGLGDSVLFLPFTANVAATLRALDVVTMPSLWEACPLLPMEAMVAGAPFVGSDCIGLREVLEGIPSKMVPTRNSQALALALMNEIRYPSKERAREFVEEAVKRFDVGRQARELEGVIKKLVR